MLGYREGPIVPSRRRLPGLVVGLVTALAGPAQAASLDGAVRLTWTSSDLAVGEVETNDRAANLSITQVLTPYLSLRFSGIYGELTSSLNGDETVSRSSLQPIAELAYRRPGLSWRIGWENRQVESSSRIEEFESNALVSNLTWQPRGDLRLSFNFRDATNEIDVAALGRDLHDRLGSVDAVYQRPFWGLGYSAAYQELRGGLGDFDVEQLRQDLRLNGSRPFADGRLRLSFAGTVGRVDTKERRNEEQLGEPLPAARGLAAIDVSPAIGELDTVEGLIDGNAVNATTPPIEIGDANTFRNVGLDLGGPRPATRLQIAVDRLSGSQVVWDVYESADGVLWEPATVTSRSFDADLLLYDLRFDETSQRYLKAVNVTVNPASDVRVTEVRALRELTEIEAFADRESELYRASALAVWRVTSRITVDAGGETSNDASTVGGIVRRDFSTSGLRAGVQIDLSRSLRFATGFRRSEYQEHQDGGLTRNSDDLFASLRWNPLPTVDALLTAGSRSDSDGQREIATTDSTRLLVSLDLLDELELITDLAYSRLGGADIGRDRDTLSWAQRVEMRPRERWRVSGGYSWMQTESGADGSVLLERAGAFVELDWTAGSALTLRGTLWYYDETGGTTLRQSYGLFWNPGPKLNVSLGWDQFEQQDGLLTGNDSLTVNYLILDRLQLFASLSRSRTDLGSGVEDEITTAHAGMNLSF